MKPLRIGFDIGGVLSKYPGIFRKMVAALVAGGAEIFIITDMHQRADTLAMLKANGFGDIPPERVYNSDFERYGEACKAILLESLGIDVFLDDFPAYVAAGCPVRLQVLPDIGRPYYDDSWQTNGSEGDFGRRKRVDSYLSCRNPEPTPREPTFGDRIKAMRKAKGLTLRQVETVCGVSNAYLSQLETGKIVKPSTKILRKLALAYGATYRNLMNIAGHMEDGD